MWCSESNQHSGKCLKCKGRCVDYQEALSRLPHLIKEFQGYGLIRRRGQRDEEFADSDFDMGSRTGGNLDYCSAHAEHTVHAELESLESRMTALPPTWPTIPDFPFPCDTVDAELAEKIAELLVKVDIHVMKFPEFKAMARPMCGEAVDTEEFKEMVKRMMDSSCAGSRPSSSKQRNNGRTQMNIGSYLNGVLKPRIKMKDRSYDKDLEESD